jgi:hypothetical protein
MNRLSDWISFLSTGLRKRNVFARAEFGTVMVMLSSRTTTTDADLKFTKIYDCRAKISGGC